MLTIILDVPMSVDRRDVDDDWPTSADVDNGTTAIRWTDGDLRYLARALLVLARAECRRIGLLHSRTGVYATVHRLNHLHTDSVQILYDDVGLTVGRLHRICDREIVGSTPRRDTIKKMTTFMQRGKPSRYITNSKVHSAFHPSGIGKSSTGLPG